MQKGLKVKFTGQKDNILNIINQIEKEFIVTQDCPDWKEDNMGKGYVFYVHVLPKPKV